MSSASYTVTWEVMGSNPSKGEDFSELLFTLICEDVRIPGQRTRIILTIDALSI